MSCNIGLNFYFDSQTSSCLCNRGYQLSEQKCADICGDGLVLASECDDANRIDGDGCSSACLVENYYRCLVVNATSLC